MNTEFILKGENIEDRAKCLESLLDTKAYFLPILHTRLQKPALRCKQSGSVVDLEPVGSISFGRIRIRIRVLSIVALPYVSDTTLF